nr:MAG TPA: hypothetical protein [Caudoviricetes sp.]
MRKRRIGTAKFFTLLLLLYHTSANAQGFQFIEKVCIYKNRANSLSLSPNPFPRERGILLGLR